MQGTSKERGTLWLRARWPDRALTFRRLEALALPTLPERTARFSVGHGVRMERAAYAADEAERLTDEAS